MKTVRVFIERGKDGSFGAYMPDDNKLHFFKKKSSKICTVTKCLLPL